MSVGVGVKEDITAWLVNWFVTNADMKESEALAGVSDNYMLKGWIDSFRFMSLISDIEEHFDIRFSNDEFHDRGFATIAGLSVIIGKKLGKRAGK